MAEAVEVLDSTTNASVVRLPGRQFPGLVVQGDALSTFVVALREADAQLAAGSIADAHDEVRDLLANLESLRIHYEAVLGQHGIALPYEMPPP